MNRIVMNRILLRSAFCALLSSTVLVAQTMSASATTPESANVPPPPVHAYINAHSIAAPPSAAPFSHIAFAGGVSPLGINMQAAANLNRHMNLRGVGNFFYYNANNLNVSGFTVNGKLNLATAGALFDLFPWANHGFRVSPGVLLFNQNGASATMQAQGGTSFSLNGYTYYSSPSNPVEGAASLALHKQNPAPMLTLGWSNLIPRTGGHWSFPVEIGAAYTGQAQIAMALTSGQVCADPQGTVNCQNVVGDPDINANLQAQIAKYQKDLKPYPFTPIVSFGVGYSFAIHKHAAL